MHFDYCAVISASFPSARCVQAHLAAGLHERCVRSGSGGSGTYDPDLSTQVPDGLTLDPIPPRVECVGWIKAGVHPHGRPHLQMRQLFGGDATVLWLVFAVAASAVSQRGEDGSSRTHAPETAPAQTCSAG